MPALWRDRYPPGLIRTHRRVSSKGSLPRFADFTCDWVGGEWEDYPLCSALVCFPCEADPVNPTEYALGRWWTEAVMGSTFLLATARVGNSLRGIVETSRATISGWQVEDLPTG